MTSRDGRSEMPDVLSDARLRRYPSGSRRPRLKSDGPEIGITERNVTGSETVALDSETTQTRPNGHLSCLQRRLPQTTDGRLDPAHAAQAAKKPEHHEDENNQPEYAAESRPAKAAVSVVAASAEQQNQQDDDKNCAHCHCPNRR